MSDADFLRGFAIALRGLIKEFDQPTIAKDIITSNGLRLEDFEGIDLAEGDLEAIRSLWKSKPARKRLSELLAQCDPTAPVNETAQEWLDAHSVGREVDLGAPVGKEN